MAKYIQLTGVEVLVNGRGRSGRLRRRRRRCLRRRCHRSCRAGSGICGVQLGALGVVLAAARGGRVAFPRRRDRTGRRAQARRKRLTDTPSPRAPLPHQTALIRNRRDSWQHRTRQYDVNWTETAAIKSAHRPGQDPARPALGSRVWTLVCCAVTRTRSISPWRPLMQVLLTFKLIVTDRLTARQQVLIPDIGQLQRAETDVVKILNFRRTGPFPPCRGSTDARAYRQVLPPPPRWHSAQGTHKNSS